MLTLVGTSQEAPASKRSVGGGSMSHDLISNRYPNSINPLISAHAEAAIPLTLGKKMFDEIAQELRKRGTISEC